MKTTAALLLTLLISFIAPAQEPDSPPALAYEIRTEPVITQFDGTFCWFHPRAGSIPGAGADGKPAVVMSLQKWFVSTSDFFSGLSAMRTDDLGATWSGPEERPELSWRETGPNEVEGICDMTPGWHALTRKLLLIGHTVQYKDNKLAPEPRRRSVPYSIYDPVAKSWTDWRTVAFPDEERFYNVGSGCGQWLAEPDGSLLVPVYYKAAVNKMDKCYAASVVRCAFDGETLSFVEAGNELAHDVPRGFCEPSLTFFQDRYYLTLRNDVKAYVSSSDNGLTFAPYAPWTFDDGQELGSYNTQQHWVTHSDALFLAYTRKGADNDDVPRNRAPLFIAQVDPGRLCVLRDTERILVPNRGAMLGNFGVATINENESWVTVGEGMYSPKAAEKGADGTVWCARVIWNMPNKLAGRVR